MSNENILLANAARSRGWTVVDDQVTEPCPNIHECSETAEVQCSRIECHCYEHGEAVHCGHCCSGSLVVPVIKDKP